MKLILYLEPDTNTLFANDSNPHLLVLDYYETELSLNVSDGCFVGVYYSHTFRRCSENVHR